MLEVPLTLAGGDSGGDDDVVVTGGVGTTDEVTLAVSLLTEGCDGGARATRPVVQVDVKPPLGSKFHSFRVIGTNVSLVQEVQLL